MKNLKETSILKIKDKTFNDVNKPEPEEDHSENSAVASHTEIFLLKKVAPELLSKSGKVSVIFIYLVWTAIATYGFLNCKIEFDFDFFMTDDTMPITKY